MQWEYSSSNIPILITGGISIALTAYARHRRTRIFLLVMLAAYFTIALYVYQGNHIPNLKLVSLAFATPWAFMALGYLRSQFLNPVPLAHGAVIESMRDGVFIFDKRNQLAYFNPAAEALLQFDLSKVVGTPAGEVFADHPKIVQRLETVWETHEVLGWGESQPPRTFDLQISPLYDRLRQFAGRLVVLQDITDQERAKLDWEKAHAELDLWVQDRTRDLISANQQLEKEINERKIFEKALRDRMDMERLVSSISTNFINRMVEEIDQEIDHALQCIGEFAGVDRSYIFRISPDGTTINNTHEWCSSGTTSQKDQLVDIPCSSLPWWIGRLSQRKPIYIPRYATLPQEARLEKEILRAKDIHSLIVVPLVNGKTMTGFLGFDSAQKEKVWAEEDIALLQLVGEIFTNALARKDAEEALRASDAELLAVFAAMNDQVLICHASGKILKIAPTNPTSQYLPASELTGKRLDEVLPAKTAISILEHIRESLATKKTVEVDYRLVLDGKQLWFSGSISPIQRDRAVLVARDITERKASEEQLVYKALHDALTGLPNRRLFMDRLERAFERIKRHPRETAAVLFLDLDGFKSINDRFGHPTGDKFLAVIAHRLRTCMRASDTVARIGGDEFAILLEDIQDVEEASQVARRIQEEISIPLELDGQSISSGTSIGIALVTIRYDHAEQILTDADAAMYRAKANGKSRHEVFNAELDAQDLVERPLRVDFHQGAEQGEFQLFY